MNRRDPQGHQSTTGRDPRVPGAVTRGAPTGGAPTGGDDGAREGRLGATLADTDEDSLLARIFAALGRGDGTGVVVGPGDDAAVLRPGPGDLVATTDAMVGGRDWLDEWSTGQDVGHKVVVQNLADVAAMGARPVGLLVTLAADPATSTAWVLDLATGLGAAAAQAGCTVLGGDLSSAGEGTVMVSVTALGSLEGRRPVLRSGARVGDVVAVCGTLGLSGAGLELLRRGQPDTDPEAVQRHLRPVSPLAQGLAAAATATSMIDVSDGLLRDAHRVASASGIRLDLAGSGFAADVERLAPSVGVDLAWRCVLSGGEEHSLLATFPSADAAAACGFRVVGTVAAGDGVTLDAVPQPPSGWDHFGG